MTAILRFCRLLAASVAVISLVPGPVAARPPRPARILAWVESSEAPAGIAARLRRMVDGFTDSVIRATSPDISREQRRLWRVALGSRAKCLLATDIGVHEPRWGAAGYILWLSETDSNGDGRIDFKDEYAIKILPERGGVARDLGRGRSAVWSPTGRLIAILSDRGLSVVDREGRPATADDRDQLIVTDSSLPELAGGVWAIRVHSGAIEPLASDLTRRLQWLGAVAADGQTIVYPNTQRTDLFIAPRGEPALGQNLTQDAFLDLDPAWSPDQQYVVYVSTNPSSLTPCR